LQYVLSNRLLGNAPALGYLKPVIRASALAKPGVRYDEALRIAEDYDLILRLLVRGARFRLLPELLYFYRRHAASISYRLSPATLAGMVAADARFREWAGGSAIAPLRAALDARLASIGVCAASESAIASLKARRPLAALATLAKQPAAIPIVARLARPGHIVRRIAAHRRRHMRPGEAPASTEPRQPVVVVLSRQRLTSGSRGNAAYLLSLCGALRESGFSLRLICPTPAVLGRVPVLRVAGDGPLFDRVAIRGTRRIGGWFVASDPRVFLRAALGVADRLARRLRINALSALAKPAPYAVGVPWATEDFLFIAAEARGQADIVLADYGFLTPGIPYVLQPDAASAVVMHDLFSSRPAAFASLGAADSVAALSEAAEADLLAGAALVIAIQGHEAAAVRRMLPPDRTVVVAPMAVEPVAVPQAGEGGGLLFVGSSTAPNVDGLRWFLDEIWPRIRAQLPDARLTVAGTVCTSPAIAPSPGVALLGRVAELAPLYRRADVVISPLRVGSGLKIKLIEALGHGKPVVATSVTAQGVEHLLEDAVSIADQPQDFAAEVMHLLTQPTLRAERAAAALAVARRSFSASAAYASAIEHLRAQHAATAISPAD
jgi:succinoglycan biosynthesis protein ExoO